MLAVTLGTVKKLIKKFSLGGGQTWQNLTGSRSSGVIYTNNTGRTIVVTASVTNGDAYNRITYGYINEIKIQADGGTYTYGNITLIVPNGATYRINKPSGSFNVWAELR